jgi:hypothetical protein
VRVIEGTFGMNETRSARSADALIAALKSSLRADEAQVFGHVVLYTSFGVVRGRTGLSFAEELANRSGPAADAPASDAVIELNDVNVEHYSNHLPTASFDRLYVRLTDVQAFALVSLQGQS